jgi:S-DNA-T family DNA segregation ATPase FtsK/SpoIIIE
VVTLLSLATYTPLDGHGLGLKEQARNLIGPAGAAWAFILFKLLGVASYVVAAALLMLAVASLRHLDVRIQAWETAGWVMLTIFAAAFLHVATSGGKVLGFDPGGYVGLYSGQGLVTLFSNVGSLVILSALILLALLIATNISIHSALVLTGRAGAAVGRVLYRGGDAALAKILPAPSDDRDEEPQEEQGRDEPVITMPAAVEKKRRKKQAESEPAPGLKPVEAEDNVVELKPARERAVREPKDAGPEITLPTRPKKKAKTEPDDDRPVYDPSKGFVLPAPSLIAGNLQKEQQFDTEALKKSAQVLEQKLRDFGVDGKVTNIRPGPVITMYEYRPGPGIKVSKIAGLTDDLAMALAAVRVRIVAPIPGKDVVGIEVPNSDRAIVYMREVIESEAFSKPGVKLALAMGKDIEGTPVVIDLARLPHLLVAGATGMGKSVSINSMIMSLLFRHTPEEVKLIMVDPKMVELKVYEGIPHLLLPVVTNAKRAALALKWAVDEMERRYNLLADLGTREIEFFNRKIERLSSGEEKVPESLKMKIDIAEQTVRTGIGPDGKPAPGAKPYVLEKLPYIVIIVDEFSDLMTVAPRDVEMSIMRLAQMARAVGIHIILATQRPSTDVISGVIKANFPARIAFQVASQIDSRTILDSTGAENLVGKGDMLMSTGGLELQRVHGAFVNEKDIHAVVEFIRAQGKPVYNDEILKARPEDGADGEGGEDEGGYDELYDQAVEIVTRERRASISYLQRKLQIGYNRAARLVEKMEEEGVLGAADHKGNREVMAPPV